MKFKRLNNKSFWILLCGLVGYFIECIINAITSFTLEMEKTNPLTGIEYTPEELSLMETSTRAGAIVGLILAVVVCVYFLMRIIKNRKVAQGQRYITVLQVFAIIFAIVALFGAATGDFLSIFGLVVYVAIAVGAIMQKKYVPPYNEADMNNGMYGANPYANPYGNNPYGNNPYGNPQANPYGDPNNPYGNPQANPYGNPQANPYGDPNNPYGNPQANPYGDPNNPYGNSQANPYGDPNNPYGNPTNNDENNNSNGGNN